MAQANEALGRVAMRGSMSAGAAQLVKLAVQFGSVVVLSRLLSPEDFGVMASLSPVLAFVAMFQDLGLKQALYQRAEATPLFLNQVFYSTLLLGLGCALAVAAASPLIAWFYDDPRLTNVTLVTSLTVLLGGWSSMPTGLMNRELQFGALASLDVASTLIGFAAVLLGAFAGLGYWALVLWPLVSSVVTLAVAWARVQWRPGRLPKRLFDRESLTFGANLTGFNFLNFFARNFDNVLIGNQLGAAQLGFYDRAYKLLLFPIQTINTPLSRIMIPLLSRLQDDPPRFRRACVRSMGQLALITVVGMAAVVPVSQEVVALVFGERWLPVAPIFFWLGLAGFVQPIGNATGWIFVAQARTGTMLRWSIYSTLTTLLAFAAGLPWGAVGVAAAYAISGYVLRTPVLYFVVAAVGPITKRDMAAIQLPLLAGAAASWALVTYVFRQALGIESYALIALSSASALVCCTLCLSGIEEGRAVLVESLELVKKAVGRGRALATEGSTRT